MKQTTHVPPAPPAVETIEYIGPGGQSSPVFGDLVAGQRYQTDPAFATYLCEQHPDYWTRPSSPKPASQAAGSEG